MDIGQVLLATLSADETVRGRAAQMLDTASREDLVGGHGGGGRRTDGRGV